MSPCQVADSTQERPAPPKRVPRDNTIAGALDAAREKCRCRSAQQLPPTAIPGTSDAAAALLCLFSSACSFAAAAMARERVNSFYPALVLAELTCLRSFLKTQTDFTM